MKKVIFIIHFFFPCDCLAYTAKAISYITDGGQIQPVIDNDCVPTLIKLLSEDDCLIVVPVLRSVGNIFAGSDAQVSERGRI